MKIYRLLCIGLIALAGLSLGAGCPLIPEIEERTVELAAGGSTTLEFEAVGQINVYNDTATYDLAADLDLGQLLDDAGIDVSDVKDIVVSGLSYRVTVPDPNPGRAIEIGNVTVQRGGGAAQQVISDFDQGVSAATGWITAPVTPGGIALLNALLSDILVSVQNGTPVANPQVTYTVSGISTPTDVPTNFTWQLKLDVSILGTVEIDVVN